jgi:hypothetical protein
MHCVILLRTACFNELLHHFIAGFNPCLIGEIGIGKHHEANFLLGNKGDISSKAIGGTCFNCYTLIWTSRNFSISELVLFMPSA